ncbi:hypothetical protein SNEBB_002002 [Seison nebaliae]|nr:hypothetical protein SNEBB_002002 [Seison nebaliae]
MKFVIITLIGVFFCLVQPNLAAYIAQLPRGNEVDTPRSRGGFGKREVNMQRPGRAFDKREVNIAQQMGKREVNMLMQEDRGG